MTGHIGGTVSHFSRFNKPKKFSKQFFKNLQLPQYYGSNYNFRVTSGIGGQTYKSVAYFMQRTMLNTLYTEVKNSKSYDLTLATSALQNNTVDQFIYISAVSGVTLISSSSLGPCDIDIYDIECKRQNGTDPVTSIDNGLTAQRNVITGGTTSARLGVYPTQS